MAEDDPNVFNDMNAGMNVDYILRMDTLQNEGSVLTMPRASWLPPCARSLRLNEAYGRGNLCQHANEVHRDLNSLGKNAIDLRLKKEPSGESWDFRRANDRREAAEYVEQKKPDCGIGRPPCTPCCSLIVLNCA